MVLDLSMKNTIGVVDPCTGATSYDAAFTLTDSDGFFENVCFFFVV